MRWIAAAALAVSLDCVHAFLDTSSLIFVSTHGPTNITLDPYYLYSAPYVRTQLVREIQRCATDNYVLISDVRDDLASAWQLGETANLQRLVQASKGSQTSGIVIDEVAGVVDTADLAEIAQEACRVSEHHGLIQLDFSDMLDWQVCDSRLKSVIDELDGQTFTVIYNRRPSEGRSRANFAHKTQIVEMDEPYADELRMEFRRDMDSHARASANNTNLPLFETYQFFTPALFISFIAALLLLLILYVGLSALSSLEVSYGAFSKEMGPAAQKRQ